MTSEEGAHVSALSAEEELMVLRNLDAEILTLQAEREALSQALCESVVAYVEEHQIETGCCARWQPRIREVSETEIHTESRCRRHLAHVTIPVAYHLGRRRG